jgi:hypothetical protein
MKKFIITEEEKNRIIEMHKKSTSRHYLMEQTRVANVTLTNNTSGTTETIDVSIKYEAATLQNDEYYFIDAYFDETKYSVGDKVSFSAKIPFKVLKFDKKNEYFTDNFTNITNNSINKSGDESTIKINFNYGEYSYDFGSGYNNGLFYEIDEKGSNNKNRGLLFSLGPK